MNMIGYMYILSLIGVALCMVRLLRVPNNVQKREENKVRYRYMYVFCLCVCMITSSGGYPSNNTRWSGLGCFSEIKCNRLLNLVL